MTTENETVIPESHVGPLESTTLAHIATIGTRGEPQSSPVWLGWDGERVVLFVRPEHTIKKDR